MIRPICTLLSLIICLGLSSAEKINVEELKCLVCKRTVEEIEKAVDSVDPGKLVEVGAFRLDHKGDQAQKKVEYRRSEVYLTDMLDQVCNTMDDYVRVTSKKTGKLMVIPLIINGMMNPVMGDYNVIQDSDLNQSVKFHCQGLIEVHEEGIIKLISQAANDLDIRICSELAKYCDQKLNVEYEFEANDEL